MTEQGQSKSEFRVVRGVLSQRENAARIYAVIFLCSCNRCSQRTGEKLCIN